MPFKVIIQIVIFPASHEPILMEVGKHQKYRENVLKLKAKPFADDRFLCKKII